MKNDPNLNPDTKIRLVPVAGKVEPDVAAAVRVRAEAEGVSRSVWVATAVREKLARAA